MSRKLLDLVVRSRDEASAVLNNISGALQGQLTILEKFGGRIPVITGAVGASMTAATMKTKAWLESLQSLSRHFDMLPEKIRKYQYAVSALGGEFRGFTEIMLEFNRIREEYEKGGAREIVQKLKIIGVLKEENDIKKSSEELMLSLADAYAEYNKVGEGSTIMMKIFGERGKDLIPILRGGREAIEKFTKEAAKLQIPITDADNTRTLELSLAFARLGVHVENLGLIISRVAYPAIKALMWALDKTLGVITYFGDILTPILQRLVWLRVIFAALGKVMTVVVIVSFILTAQVLKILILGLKMLGGELLWTINLSIRAAVGIANLGKSMLGLGTATKFTAVQFGTLTLAVKTFFRATIVLWIVIELIGIAIALVTEIIGLFTRLNDTTGETHERMRAWARVVAGSFSLLVKLIYWFTDLVGGVPPMVKKIRTEQQGYTSDVLKTNKALEGTVGQLDAIGKANPLAQMIREMYALSEHMLPAYIHTVQKVAKSPGASGPGEIPVGQPAQLGWREYMSGIVTGKQNAVKVEAVIKIDDELKLSAVMDNRINKGLIESLA